MLSHYPNDLCGCVSSLPDWLCVKWSQSGGLALIFGCGPSLDDMPDEFWSKAENILSCGVNGFPHLAPVFDRHFVPDIWLGIDAIRDQDKVENYPGIRDKWESKKPDNKPLRLMAVANCSSTVTDLYFGYVSTFTSKPGFCKYGRSSVQAATHWIANTFTPGTIALIGVDYRGPGRAGGLSGNASHQHGGRLESDFDEMYKAVTSMGVRLVNCSPDTGLQAIPQVDWKDILT